MKLNMKITNQAQAVDKYLILVFKIKSNEKLRRINVSWAFLTFYVAIEIFLKKYLQLCSVKALGCISCNYLS